jgi:hypothetical protein
MPHLLRNHCPDGIVLVDIHPSESFHRFDELPAFLFFFDEFFSDLVQTVCCNLRSFSPVLITYQESGLELLNIGSTFFWININAQSTHFFP